MKKIIVLLSTILYAKTITAQTLIKGKIIESETHKPIFNVYIENINGNEWTFSKKNGTFSIKLNTVNDAKLKFSLQGMESKTLDLSQMKKSQFIITMEAETLYIGQVTVTGVPKRDKIGSAIHLGQNAINQVQSYGLLDVLNQLPGHSIKPPSLHQTNILTLRTSPLIDKSALNLNAFGVSYILDGMQLSNDENIQSYNTLDKLTKYDNPNTGLDLRTIPSSNIEEVEVIQGIPDAKYGDLTTGVINIKRKAGITPYILRASIDQGNTNLSLLKGVRLGKMGDLTLSFDYLNANADPRNSLENFDRITASTIYSVHNSSNQIRNTLSFTYHYNFDDKNYDKDNEDGGKDAKFKKDQGFMLSNRFSYNPASHWIDNLSTQFGVSYSKQHSYTQSFINNGGVIAPKSLETGLVSAPYTPVAYLQIREVFGQPLRVNGSFSIKKQFNVNKVNNNLQLGFNASYSDNFGRGKAYDSKNAHASITLKSTQTLMQSGEGFRPVNFRKYIKPIINMGAYIQNNAILKFDNGKKLFANIGFRYDVQNKFPSFSPRINVGYELTNKLSIKGGFGFASKAPSLGQIYPGDKYIDILLGDFRTSDYAFNLVQTYKKEIKKMNLKPSKVWKYELGMSYIPAFGNFRLTAFYNRTYDGITSQKNFKAVPFPEVEYDFSGDYPSYEVKGYAPKLITYSLPVNALQNIDKGLELLFTTKKIRTLNTSFSLDASYTKTNTSSSLLYYRENETLPQHDVAYGVYEPLPRKYENIFIRCKATYHLPSFGLLISLTAEQFTYGKTYAVLRNRYPIAYINGLGEAVPIAKEERDDQKFKGLVYAPSVEKDAIIKLYHNFHLDIEKEFINGLKLSLHFYNFLDYHPLIKSTATGRLRKNALINFGAQIQYKF